MTRMSNQEKSARRYEALTKIAQKFAAENEEFRSFCEKITMTESRRHIPLRELVGEVTWRKLETFIKRKASAGATVKIVIESGGD